MGHSRQHGAGRQVRGALHPDVQLPQLRLARVFSLLFDQVTVTGELQHTLLTYRTPYVRLRCTRTRASSTRAASSSRRTRRTRPASCTQRRRATSPPSRGFYHEFQLFSTNLLSFPAEAAEICVSRCFSSSLFFVLDFRKCQVPPARPERARARLRRPVSARFFVLAGVFEFEFWRQILKFKRSAQDGAARGGVRGRRLRARVHPVQVERVAE